MRIARHSIGREDLPVLFGENCELLSVLLAQARKATKTSGLLAGIADSVYRTGSVVSTDSSEVARAIKLAAQANTAVLVFARIEDPPRYCPLGDGPPVTYSEPVDESHVYGSQWVQAFFETTITRQADLQSMLVEVPTDLLRQSSTHGEEAAYQWVDMHRAIWTDRYFTRHSAFAAVEDYFAKVPPRSSHGKAVKDITIPYLEVLRQLEGEDQARFNDALTEALQMHKKYWGATEKRRKDFNGFVSLQLTAVAALAWDRGMRFEVKSDYMPASWVRGELFFHS